MARFEILLLSVIIAMVASVGQASLLREMTADDPLVKSFIALMSTPFKWENCGADDLPLKFNHLSLSPDPVAVPGEAKVSLDGTLTRDVNSPVKVALRVQKKMVVWIELPCEKGIFGSCTFNDVCPMLEQVICDEGDKSDVTCHCPFKKGTYNLPLTPIHIDDKLVPFPWIVVRGQYKIHVDISDNQGPVGCLNLQFTLA